MQYKVFDMITKNKISDVIMLGSKIDEDDKPRSNWRFNSEYIQEETKVPTC